jgi:hypothetical protein
VKNSACGAAGARESAETLGSRDLHRSERSSVVLSAPFTCIGSIRAIPRSARNMRRLRAVAVALDP